MSLQNIKALTFDTSGTLIDLHSEINSALYNKKGKKYTLEQNWFKITLVESFKI